MTREALLGDLLMRWEELRQQGKSVAAEDLCTDTPELRDELHRRIEALKALDQVLAITPQPRHSTLTCEQSAPRPRELPAIPGYEVLGELGHGGMGVVYKVRNVGIGRIEALKMMVSPKPHMIERFRQEIRAIAQFEHQRVVRIYAAGPADGQPYFTMEYIGGGSLSAHLGRFKADRSAAVGLLAKVAQAVHFLHTMNIIHRDLKPGNILLKDQDEPLVSDFGLATFFEREMETAAPEPSGADSQLTLTGAIVGTTSYMSPEQAGGRNRELTAATDVWALGVILYELVTGRRPFVGNDEAAVRNAILHSEPVSPRTLQPKIDRDLEAICLKCLQKEPLCRYPSAEALAQDLGCWLRGEPILPERMPRRIWRRIRRHYVLSSVLLGIALLGVVLAAARYLADPERKLEAVQAKLARGESVTLIGATGGPAWESWLTGRHASQTSTADGAFTIHSQGRATLALLRDPQVDRYSFRAEVRHEKGSLNAEVGIFFGLQEYEIGNHVLFFFLRAGFDDTPMAPLPKSNPVYLSPYLYADAERIPVWDQEVAGRRPPLLKPAGPNGGPWRQLEVEVTPEGLRGVWETQDIIGQITAIEVEKNTRYALSTMQSIKADGVFLKGITPKYCPRAPLGVYVYKGSVSFRHVVIEPILAN